MKKIIYLLLLTFVFTACTNDDSKLENNIEEFSFKEFTGSKIAYESKGELKLNVSKQQILKTFSNYSKKYGESLEPETFKIIKLDNKNYLRLYSKNSTVSTVALIKDSDNFYKTGSTVCETKACASGGGCIPNGDYCTKCRPEGTPTQAPDGDCKRTSTGPVIDPGN